MSRNATGVDERATRQSAWHVRFIADQLADQPTVVLRVLALIALIMAFSPTPAVQGQTDVVARRVEALMATMTTEQKVGQLFLVAFSGPQVSPSLKRMIARYHIGGIVLFESAGNIRSVGQVVKLINDAQALATANGARIPLFVAIDEEGGKVTRLSRIAAWFPSQMALGATDSQAHARAMARAVAVQLRALGINMNLAPVLDVNDNPYNPVIGTRAFGSSPELVARLGAAMVDEYKQQGILATPKHFPGHGSTDVDSHDALPVVSRTLQSLVTTDVLPFVHARADAIMTAHVLYSSLDANAPATLSPAVLQGMLRSRLGFEGLIVSDSLLMRAITGDIDVNEAAVRAFRAGVDVLAIGAAAGYTRLDRRTTYQAVLDAVNAEPALQRRLDESVRRILTIKARYGLLDHRPADPKQAAVVLGNAAHREVADRIARDSVTLVRDEGGLVPLQPEANILLVLPAAANDLGSRMRTCHRKLTVIRMSQNPTFREAATLVRRAKQFDVVIVATMNVNKHPGQASVVKSLGASEVPMIVVALQSPYDLLAFPEVKSYLTAFSDVPVSLQALADVLCGRADAQGTIPVQLWSQDAR